MKNLAYENGFDRRAFTDYINNEYETNAFCRDIIDSIIEYAHNHEHVSKDQFADFVSDLLGIEFAEVAAFCEDHCLTRYGIEKKHDFWNERED